jgi:hypothetical protein
MHKDHTTLSKFSTGKCRKTCLFQIPKLNFALNLKNCRIQTFSVEILGQRLKWSYRNHKISLNTKFHVEWSSRYSLVFISKDPQPKFYWNCLQINSKFTHWTVRRTNYFQLGIKFNRQLYYYSPWQNLPSLNRIFSREIRSKGISAIVSIECWHRGRFEH